MILPSLAELRIVTVRHSHDRAKLPFRISLIDSCFIEKTQKMQPFSLMSVLSGLVLKKIFARFVEIIEPSVIGVCPYGGYNCTSKAVANIKCCDALFLVYIHEQLSR